MPVAPPRARPSNGGRPQSRFPGELISVPAVSQHHSGGPPAALSTGHSTPRAPAASDHNPGSTSSARAGLRHAHAPTPPKQSSAALGVVTYQKPSLECVLAQADRRGTHASTDLHSIASSPHPAGGSAFARAPVAFTRCLPDAGSTTCCASWTSMAWSWAATSRAATLSAPKLSSSRGKTSPDPCSWSHRGINNCAWGTPRE